MTQRSHRIPSGGIAPSIAAGLIILLVAAIPAGLVHAQPQPSGNPEFDVTQLNLHQVSPLTQQMASYRPDPVGWAIEAASKVVYKLLDVATDLVTAPFVTIAGGIFSLAVDLALLPLWKTSFVQLGSAITLGVANMFFVLILLWIAIATIFDFEPFTARRLLLKLIIAALLINFSVAIGSAFIRLSNAMANIFYQQIGGGAIGIGGEFINLSKFAPVKNATPGNPQTGDPPGVLAGLLGYLAPPKTKNFSFAAGLQAIIGKLAVTPVLIFVLLAGAFFLLVRQIALTFLLVLAPLAFLFLALPQTQRFHNDWWGRLTKWAFFFPAFMFFLFLSLKTGGALLSAYTGNNKDPIYILFQYFLVIGLMLGSLIVAHQMSIYGSSAIINWGKRSAAAAGKFAGTMALRFAAPQAQRIAAGEGRIGALIQRVPGLANLATRASQVVTAADRQKIGEREKALAKYNTDELKRIASLRGSTLNTRAAAISLLEQRHDLRTIPSAPDFNVDRIRQVAQAMHEIGMDIRAIERARPDAAVPTQMVLNPLTGQMQLETQANATHRAASQARPTDLENMDVSTHANPHAVRGIVDSAGSAHMQKIVERNDQLTEAVVREVEAAAGGVIGPRGRPSAAAVAAGLHGRNPGLARFVVSDVAGRTLLDLDP